MLSRIISGVKDTYTNLLNEKRSIIESKYDTQNLSSFLKDSISLSHEEKELVSARWGKIIKKIERGFPFFRGMKKLDKFNTEYLPSCYFYPYIEGILNPIEWKYQLSHKSLIELIYGAEINHPLTILRSCGGVLLDQKFKPILKSQVKNIIYRYQQPLLYKPAIESLQGAGIKLIQPKDFDVLTRDIESGNIFNRCKEFVLQVPVKQSKETSLFNSTSLNCMRITTINLNGVVTVGTRALKCGPRNSVVDNIGSGRRGVIVGVNSDGSLKCFGFYGNGDIAYKHNDIEFAGHTISHFSRVENAAKSLHALTPNCKIIGWDMALDENNNPVLIEGNTIYPGISFEQMCSGPVFAERTQEVIDYIFENQRYNRGR